MSICCKTIPERIEYKNECSMWNTMELLWQERHHTRVVTLQPSGEDEDRPEAVTMVVAAADMIVHKAVDSSGSKKTRIKEGRIKKRLFHSLTKVALEPLA
jgi:hypothetical protein